MSDHIYVRMTPELKAKVVELAKADGRSVNSYVVRLLERVARSSDQGGRSLLWVGKGRER